MTKPSIYVYYYKGEYVYSGTLREIAEHTGKPLHSLRTIATPSYKNKAPHRENWSWAVKLEDEE